MGVVERGRDILVNPLGRQPRTTSIVVEVNGQEDWFVGNVCQSTLVEKVKAGDKFFVTT